MPLGLINSDRHYGLYPLYFSTFVFAKRTKSSSASSLKYHLRSRRKLKSPTSENCYNETHFGKGDGEGDGYLLSRRITQHMITQSTEFTMKHTQKVIW